MAYKAEGKELVYKSDIRITPIGGLLRRLQKHEDVTYLFEIFYPAVDVSGIQRLYKQQEALQALVTQELENIESTVLKDLAYKMVDTNQTIDKYHFTTTQVRRSEGSGYALKTSQLQYLWNMVRPYWGGVEDAPDFDYRSYSGWQQKPVASKTRIKIGCQEIERWELEQLTIRFN